MKQLWVSIRTKRENDPFESWLVDWAASGFDNEKVVVENQSRFSTTTKYYRLHFIEPKFLKSSRFYVCLSLVAKLANKNFFVDLGWREEQTFSIYIQTVRFFWHFLFISRRSAYYNKLFSVLHHRIFLKVHILDTSAGAW